MIYHLKFIGIVLIALALIHSIFPKYFNWQEELKPLSLVNRQMMIIHTFFIALTVFLMGVLCLLAPYEMVETHLGKLISLGLAFFWLIRFVIQFVGYSPKLWKGKAFETAIHIVFSVFWLYLTIIFFVIFLS